MHRFFLTVVFVIGIACGLASAQQASTSQYFPIPVQLGQLTLTGLTEVKGAELCGDHFIWVKSPGTNPPEEKITIAIRGPNIGEGFLEIPRSVIRTLPDESPGGPTAVLLIKKKVLAQQTVGTPKDMITFQTEDIEVVIIQISDAHYKKSVCLHPKK